MDGEGWRRRGHQREKERRSGRVATTFCERETTTAESDFLTLERKPRKSCKRWL